jgi:hypothetical protein
VEDRVSEDDDLYERLGLSPLASEVEIATRLRELVEDADDAERARLRAAFDALTRAPAARFARAMATFHETEPLALPRRPIPTDGDATQPALPALSDSPLRTTLGVTLELLGDPAALTNASWGYVPLEDDPVLNELTRKP